MSNARLPHDVLWEAAQYLKPRDIISCRLTSKWVNQLLISVLYESVELKTHERCEQGLDYLLAHPNVLHHVRKLVLRPSHFTAPSARLERQESALIPKLKALTPNLCNLSRFIWDGLEAPDDDDIWKILRESCPKLKSIGSCVGAKDLCTDSELFNFTDLKSFSFVAKPGEMRLRLEPDHLPEPLLTMLINNCPNLECLHIGSYGSGSRYRRFDFRPFLKASWPHLKDFSLGVVAIADWDTHSEDVKTYREWLGKHSSLKEVHYFGGTSYPLSDSIKISKFTGTLLSLNLDQLSHLTHLSLSTVTLSANLINMVTKGPRFHSTILQSLSIWIDFSQPISFQELDRFDFIPRLTREEQLDHIARLKPLLDICPKLQDFTLMCSTRSKYSCKMKDLSALLQCYSHLRNVQIHKVHILGEEDCLATATRLARKMPKLESVKLYHHLMRWNEYKRAVVRQYGIYDVVREHQTGEPLRLVGEEMSIGFKSPNFRKRTKVLTPRKGLAGLVSRVLREIRQKD